MNSSSNSQRCLYLSATILCRTASKFSISAVHRSGGQAFAANNSGTKDTPLFHFVYSVLKIESAVPALVTQALIEGRFKKVPVATQNEFIVL